MSHNNFPPPVKCNGRLYWNRNDLERYKFKMLDEPAPPIDWAVPVELVPASKVIAEFGFGRRTLGRRIAESLRVDQSAK